MAKKLAISSNSLGSILPGYFVGSGEGEPPSTTPGVSPPARPMACETYVSTCETEFDVGEGDCITCTLMHIVGVSELLTFVEGEASRKQSLEVTRLLGLVNQLAGKLPRVKNPPSTPPSLPTPGYELGSDPSSGVELGDLVDFRASYGKVLKESFTAITFNFGQYYLFRMVQARNPVIKFTLTYKRSTCQKAKEVDGEPQETTFTVEHNGNPTNGLATHERVAKKLKEVKDKVCKDCKERVDNATHWIPITTAAPAWGGTSGPEPESAQDKARKEREERRKKKEEERKKKEEEKGN